MQTINTYLRLLEVILAQRTSRNLHHSYDNGFIMFILFNSVNAIYSGKKSCNVVLRNTFIFSPQLVVAEAFVDKGP